MSLLCDRLMHAADRKDRGRDGLLPGSAMNGPQRREGGIATHRRSHDPFPASDRDADVPGHAGRIHRQMIEVQVGSDTGEDDIVRFEDVYGR